MEKHDPPEIYIRGISNCLDVFLAKRRRKEALQGKKEKQQTEGKSSESKGEFSIFEQSRQDKRWLGPGGAGNGRHKKNSRLRRRARSR